MEKLFIAKWYFITNVETSEPLYADALKTIFECEIDSIEDFEEWLDAQEERETFLKWLYETELDYFWNKK